MTQPPEYRLLAPSEIRQAAYVLSEAFMDDPLYVFMLPFRKTRLSALRKFFQVYVKEYTKYRQVYGIGNPLEAVAIWRMPDDAVVKISLRSLSILLPLLTTLYPIGYLRSRMVMGKVHELYKKYAVEPNYYLACIGVLSSARGKRLASKLIKPFLEMADSKSTIVYLETYLYSNVALYEHFGFQCLENTTVEGTGVTIWAMRRPG